MLGMAWHGVVRFGVAWLGWALVWLVLVWFDVLVKLNYQVSLLARVGWVGKIETKAKPSLG